MEKTVELKSKTKDFFYRNKEKLKTYAKVGIAIISIGTSICLIKDNRKKTYVIRSMKNIIIEQNERIYELKDLCERKDSFMCSLISKLLRNGISEGGRQMVYRKQWLKQKKITC